MHNGEGTNSEGSEHSKSANDTSHETEVEIKGKDHRQDSENSGSNDEEEDIHEDKDVPSNKEYTSSIVKRMKVLKVLTVIVA